MKFKIKFFIFFIKGLIHKFIRIKKCYLENLHFNEKKLIENKLREKK